MWNQERGFFLLALSLACIVWGVLCLTKHDEAQGWSFMAVGALSAVLCMRMK